MKSEDVVTEVIKPKALGVRHIQVVMLFLSMAICYMTRANITLAIVSMTDTENDPDAFDWSVQMQSVIMSSFFWGYIVLQVPAGEMAARFGGHLLILLCVGINSVVNVFIPIGSYYGGWQLICAFRVIQGLSQGFLFPSTYTLMGKWVPLDEKGRFGALVFAGAQIGTTIQYVVSGFLADAWGWPAIFYFNGVVGALWCAGYVFVAAPTPQHSKIIKPEEKLYILTSLDQQEEQKKLATPWRAILTSPPFYALMIVQCGQNWGLWTLMTELPSYMDKILGVDIVQNGLLSALPHLTKGLVSMPMGYLADYVLLRGWLTTSQNRKVFNSVGHYGPAIALVVLCFTPSTSVAVQTTIFCVVVGLNAANYSGFMLVHIDMAPNFAGIIMGCTNCIANIVSIIAPIVAGTILRDETNPSDWHNVFFLAAGIYFLGNTIFLFFGTSVRQKWNEPPHDDAQEDSKSKA